jgi:hypothetical protein
MVGSAGATATYVALATSAPYTTLSDLLPTGDYYTTVSNLNFGDFAYAPGTVGYPPPATAIDVTAATGTGGPGLEFTGTWTVIGAKTLTSTIDYYVAVQGTKYVMNDANLIVSATLPTGCSAKVVETVYDVVGGVKQTPAIATLTYTGKNDPVSLGGNYATLYITEQISVKGVTGETAYIGGITNQFSEKLAPVPVPPSLLLFAPGLLGLVGLRKKFFG